jgi:hypothetical protein
MGEVTVTQSFKKKMTSIVKDSKSSIRNQPAMQEIVKPESSN